ncbi:MAG: hypothetical protein NTW29_19905 [Bacteroidetes bacterium]|nr:hypothetical protein [Bacteroidota bacterium]
MKKMIILSVIVLLTACQPSKITQSWAAPDARPSMYKKVLVLGVLSDNDIELQSKIENHVAEDLRALGYMALAANKVFPAGTFVKGDTTRAVNALLNSGFDGILTIVLLDKKKERYYVPGRITDYTNPGQYGAFNRYYNRVAERIYSPDYHGEETKYIWENNFYDLTGKRMIYSARSRTFDIASKNTLAHTYGQLMAESLVNKNILIKPKPAEE